MKDSKQSVSQTHTGPFLTAPEVASLYQIAASTVYQFAHRGIFRATKFGKAIRFDPATLREDVQKLTTGRAA